MSGNTLSSLLELQVPSKKSADPDSQTDVDTAILEYLMYMATMALLGDADTQDRGSLSAASSRKTELSLEMVNSFLTIYHVNHPSTAPSSLMKFRLRLLKFTTLFINRLSPVPVTVSANQLDGLRSKHRSRAHALLIHRSDLIPATSAFASYRTSLPLPTSTLVDHGTNFLRELSIPIPPTPYYGKSTSLSLLDTLPLFIALSAAHTSLNDFSVNDLWMRLGARYMASAALEQYLIYGASGVEPLTEAFAYGFDDRCNAEDGSDELAIAAMFWGREEKELEGWEEIRLEHLDAFIPPDGVPLQEHLEKLATGELSLVSFERSMVEFLKRLLAAQPLPLLVQAEKGRTAGALGPDRGGILE